VFALFLAAVSVLLLGTSHPFSFSTERGWTGQDVWLTQFLNILNPTSPAAAAPLASTLAFISMHLQNILPCINEVIHVLEYYIEFLNILVHYYASHDYTV
jgi:hypothetical protein